MLTRDQLTAALLAIKGAVNRSGAHPDDLDLDALVREGLDRETSDIAFALLASYDFPADIGAAVAKWNRLLAEHTDHES